jgi:hypothetical protein
MSTVQRNVVGRRWIVPLFVTAAIVLVPWTLILAYNLPARHTSQHWDVAWVGFDIALALALAATGVAIYKRSPWAQSTAAVAATLLICDAWFDNILANGTGERLEALAEAAFLELPLAILCVWLARDAERSVEALLASLPRGRRARRDRELAGVEVRARGDAVLQPVDGRQGQRRKHETAGEGAADEADA